MCSFTHSHQWHYSREKCTSFDGELIMLSMDLGKWSSMNVSFHVIIIYILHKVANNFHLRYFWKLLKIIIQLCIPFLM